VCSSDLVRLTSIAMKMELAFVKTDLLEPNAINAFQGFMDPIALVREKLVSSVI